METPSSLTQITNTTEAPAAPMAVPYGVVIDALASGSWAVLIVFAVIFWGLRKQVTGYIERQTHLLGTLEDTLRLNAETLQTMADTDKQTSDTLKAIAVQTSRENRAIWVALKEIRTFLNK